MRAIRLRHAQGWKSIPVAEASEASAAWAENLVFLMLVPLQERRAQIPVLLPVPVIALPCESVGPPMARFVVLRAIEPVRSPTR
jgi:hypothetical protein